MKIFGSRVLWGLLLITGGILFLLDNMNIISLAGIFWALLFAVAGIIFLYTYFTERENWWALIPGFIFLSLGALIALSELFPGIEGGWTGGVFLAGIGLAFIAVYLANRAHWWGLIPGGVMLTVALVAVIDGLELGVDSGAVLFIGMGLTFALVGSLPTEAGRMRWAYIPAGILLLMGVVILGAAENLLNYIWPVALILVGLFLVWRTLIRRRS